MKRTILILSVIATLVSCKDRNSVVISRDEYNRLKDGTSVQYPKPFVRLNFDDLDSGYRQDYIILGSDGHDYIITSKGIDRENMVHSPECPKCENKLREIIYEITKPKDTIR